MARTHRLTESVNWLLNCHDVSYHSLTIINAKNGLRVGDQGSQDGEMMGRAFREGIEKDRKIPFSHGMKRMLNIGGRANRSRLEEGQRMRVPAMITVEDEEWVWEQVSAEVLASLSHRLMIQGEDGRPQPLGCTADFDTAMALAKEMASDGQVVLIEPNL